MSDFLTRLAQRQLGELAMIEPRVASVYAPRANDFGVVSIAEDIEHQPAPEASQSRDVLSETNQQPLKDRLYSHEHVPTESSLPKEKPLKTQFAELIHLKLSSEHHADNLHRRQSDLGQSGPSPNNKLPLVNSIKPDSGSVIDHQNQFIPPAALGLREDQRHNSARQVEEPPVHVTIGRIEVTAVTAATAPRPAPAPRRQGMSLDEYLSRRQRRQK
jgi:hypothetical protein